jgi:hypothetical protein
MPEISTLSALRAGCTVFTASRCYALKVITCYQMSVNARLVLISANKP